MRMFANRTRAEGPQAEIQGKQMLSGFPRAGNDETGSNRVYSRKNAYVA